MMTSHHTDVITVNKQQIPWPSAPAALGVESARASLLLKIQLITSNHSPLRLEELLAFLCDVTDVRGSKLVSCWLFGRSCCCCGDRRTYRSVLADCSSYRGQRK